MAFQTSYALTHTAGFAGMKGDAADDYVRTYIQAETSAEMPFGIMVCQGSTADKAILPVDANSVGIGVLLHSHAYAKTTELGDTGLKPKTALSVMVRGQVWVYVEDAVAVNGIPFFRHTAEAPDLQVGTFRSDIDTDKATKVRGCRFLTATTGAGIALLEVDIPAYIGLRGVTGY